MLRHSFLFSSACSFNSSCESQWFSLSESTNGTAMLEEVSSADIHSLWTLPLAQCQALTPSSTSFGWRIWATPICFSVGPAQIGATWCRHESNPVWLTLLRFESLVDSRHHSTFVLHYKEELQKHSWHSRYRLFHMMFKEQSVSCSKSPVCRPLKGDSHQEKISSEWDDDNAIMA